MIENKEGLSMKTYLKVYIGVFIIGMSIGYYQGSHIFDRYYTDNLITDLTGCSSSFQGLLIAFGMGYLICYAAVGFRLTSLIILIAGLALGHIFITSGLTIGLIRRSLFPDWFTEVIMMPVALSLGFYWRVHRENKKYKKEYEKWKWGIEFYLYAQRNYWKSIKEELQKHKDLTLAIQGLEEQIRNFKEGIGYYMGFDYFEKRESSALEDFYTHHIHLHCLYSIKEEIQKHKDPNDTIQYLEERIRNSEHQIEFLFYTGPRNNLF